MAEKITSAELRSQLAQFQGGDQTYRHNFARSVIYTSGVKYFADNAGGGARWFLDILATEPKIRRQGQDFALILLKVKDSKAKIIVTDGNDGTPGIFKRNVDFTDCPEGEWKFYFENGMIMLPGER